MQALCTLESFINEKLGYEPGMLKADGFWHDGGVGKDKGKLRYCINSTYCTFKDHRCSEWYTWHSGQSGTTNSVQNNLQQLTKQKVAQEQARQKAQALWQKAKPANPQHPYLLRKQIRPIGIRQLGQYLLIPLRNYQNQLVSLQFIAENGSKRFLKGTPKKGNFLVLGESPSASKHAYVVEGYATGVSLISSLGGAVIVSFDCENLKCVTTYIHCHYPDIELIVVCDDDRDKTVNAGRNAGLLLLNTYGIRVCVPNFPSTAPLNLSDVNDLVVYRKSHKPKGALLQLLQDD